MSQWQKIHVLSVQEVGQSPYFFIGSNIKGYNKNRDQIKCII